MLHWTMWSDLFEQDRDQVSMRRCAKLISRLMECSIARPLQKVTQHMSSRVISPVWYLSSLEWSRMSIRFTPIMPFGNPNSYAQDSSINIFKGHNPGGRWHQGPPKPIRLTGGECCRESQIPYYGLCLFQICGQFGKCMFFFLMLFVYFKWLRCIHIPSHSQTNMLYLVTWYNLCFIGRSFPSKKMNGTLPTDPVQ